MAEERDDHELDENEDQQPTGQQSQQIELEQQQSMSGQPVGGKDSASRSGTVLGQGAEFGGEVASGQAQPGSGSEPPRSMGTRGTEFGQFGDATGPAGQQGQSGTGQADLGSQADTTIAGRTDQQDFNVDPAGQVGGAGSRGSTDEAFIGAQGSGSDDYLQERRRPSSAEATGGSDFAREGRGVIEDEDEDGNEGQPS